MQYKRFVSVLCSAAAALSFVSAGSAAVFAEASGEKQLVETVLYEGTESASNPWTLALSIQTANGSGEFDPNEISEGGYFAVTYTGTEGAVYLALSEWSGIWAAVNIPTSTESNGSEYISTFSYEECNKSYKEAAESVGKGESDISEIHAVSVGTSNSEGETVIKKISWLGYPSETEPNATKLFGGSKKASSASSCLTFFYTKHVGGDWDASSINKDSYFTVDYTGPENGIYLAFASASGATNWVSVYPDSTTQSADGRWHSVFSYSNFSEKFGTNFARLDQIQVYTATNEETALKKLTYTAGTGAPVDTSDGTWDRPDTGIAFIGDSIVQNPLVDSEHLNNIDWNGILNRTDCVNYGIGGQTTKECSARIGELAKKNYSKAVILCGINDIGRGLTDEQIAANDKIMIDALRNANEDIELFIISVLPTTPVYYTDSQNKIKELNSRLKTLAETENITFIDCHSSFLREDGQYCREELVFDGLHPNLNGYKVIAEILAPYLNEASEPAPEVSDTTETASPSPDASISTTAQAVPSETTDRDENANTGIAFTALPAAAAAGVAIVFKKRRK